MHDVGMEVCHRASHIRQDLQQLRQNTRRLTMPRDWVSDWSWIGMRCTVLGVRMDMDWDLQCSVCHVHCYLQAAEFRKERKER